ncbi:MAG: hypothetical protein ACSHXY_04675 [Alphaproteobacteria bacterium]
MTENEIINELRGCFGLEDRKFAGHPSDEIRAFDLLQKLREDNVGWEVVEMCVRRLLLSNKKLNADEQVAEVKKYYRPWILD